MSSIKKKRLSINYLPNIFINRLLHLITKNHLFVQAARIARSSPTNDTLNCLYAYIRSVF